MKKNKRVSLLLSQEASIECYLLQHTQIHFSRNQANRKPHLWELLRQAIGKALGAPNLRRARTHLRIAKACLSSLVYYHG
jgi:hypothetical protein